MSIIEERIAQISELESVASNPANDAMTRKIASGRIINLRHLIQSQQGSSHAGQRISRSAQSLSPKIRVHLKFKKQV